MDRNTDYMAIYKNISAKMKRRFLKKPNVAEGRDQFASLAKNLGQQDCPSYAAFCSLAQARCEHVLGNNSGEVQCLLEAAHFFVLAEKQSTDLLCPSYEENLTAGINCYEHAVKVSLEAGEPALAACHCQELATVLMDFKKPSEARIHFQRAAELQLQNPVECLQNMKKVAACRVKESDLEGALTILTEMQFLAQERGGVAGSEKPLGVYADIILHCELQRVLLLMILQPTPQRIRPEHAQTLEKYAWQTNNDEYNYIVDLFDIDLFLLLQSLVMSCQSNDIDGLRFLQTELMSKLDKEENELVHMIVELYLNK
ncbi:40-kDa huntingtin-associated protein-like [Watersipora subatra]|uniref:40-kDa huntingtin-associated protein-like n=1 Tax=Watersipora subatra TaxID=2589382 RepID=UPI00355C4472